MNNFTEYARGIMIDALPGTLYVSVHDADPGGVGLSETPGTTRAEITLTGSSDGMRAAQEAYVDIEVATDETVAYVGVFDSLTGGNFICYIAVDPFTFQQDSVFRVSDISFDLNLDTEIDNG